MSDPLGSIRLVTDASGQPVSTHDYLPFGEEIPATWGTRGPVYGLADGLTQRFTGAERDAEAGLDHFGARFFSAAQGRLSSPDAPFADQDTNDPQSWNMYSYVRNNPLRFIDPSGRACVYIGPEGSTKPEDINSPSNYRIIGTEHGTCADAFSNDVLLTQGAQRVLKDVLQTTQGPVNLIGYGLMLFFEFVAPATLTEPPVEPVSGISQGRTNLRNSPGPQGFFKVLRAVRDKACVQDILVEVNEVVEEDPQTWPFSDRIYVLSSAAIDQVRDWLAPL